MMRFVLGTSETFDFIDEKIADGALWCVKDVILPLGCTPERPMVRDCSSCDAVNNINDVVNRDKVIDLINNSKNKIVYPEEIAQELKQNIYGQDSVMDKIAEKIAVKMLSKEARPLTMVFLGPTATGKSETARSLASILSNHYGEQYGFLEIAGNEFVSEHAVYRFLGAPPSYVGSDKPTLLEPVCKNPKHVIVINEIEKANQILLTALMEAIDTGYLELSNNSKIYLGECIIIFTSNLPIDMKHYNGLSRFYQNEFCKDVFTDYCGRPEISGKIGCFFAFNQLDDKAVMEIVIKFTKEALANYNLCLKHMDEQLMSDFLRCKTKYGARGIRELVSDAVGEYLLSNHGLEKLQGNSVSLKGSVDNLLIEAA